MVRVNYSKLFPIAACYISLPLAIFLATWLKLLFAVPLAVAMVVCVVVSIRSRSSACNAAFRRPVDFIVGRVGLGDGWAGEREGVDLSRCIIALLVVIALAWCFFGGIGGMWTQSKDWNIRNAVFRDLMTHSWPVRYDGGESALSYYIGHWLPVAAIGRTLVRVGVSLDVVWPLANVLLLLWTALGVLLVELLAIVTVGVRGKRGAILVALMLVFFSTPDIVGMVLADRWDRVHSVLHLEWWCTEQITSITSCLFWVFNQAVIPWICTLCFLNERSFRNYFFLWLCCAFCGPLPCIGLAVLMLGQGIGVLLDSRARSVSPKGALRGILSVPNVLAILLTPIVVLFFMANGATSNPTDAAVSAGLLPYPFWFPFDPERLRQFLLLIPIEGLLLSILVARDNLRNPVFWVMAAMLPLCQFIRVGNDFDFGMRATIPAVLILYVFCARFLRDHFGKKEKRRSFRIQAAVLAIALLLGAATPALEFYRGFHDVAYKGLVEAATQYDRGTLQGLDFTHLNFGTASPDDTIFYKYLAG